MESLELNKVAAGVLCAVLLAMASSRVADMLVDPQPLAEPAYKIAMADTDESGDAAAPAPATPELAPVMGMLAGADVAAGQKIFKKCAACHTMDKGGRNRVGPNLYNVVNAAKGMRDGFAYSAALMEFAGTEMWNYAALNAFLAKPRAYIPGTKMTFVGLKKVSDRADVIAYLRSFADVPAPLPTAAEIAEEANGG